MPFKDKEKRREYNREYIKRKRKEGTYETPYQAWKREQLRKNPSADTSFKAYFAHLEELRLIKKRWKKHEEAFTPQPNQEPLKGVNPWHAEQDTSLICSRCGKPYEENDSPTKGLCGECYIEMA